MPITAPIAIWKRGRGRGSGTTRDRMPLRMTASSSRRMIDMVSKAPAAPSTMNSAFQQCEEARFGRRLGHPSDQMGDYRSEENKSELQSLMRISYAVFFLNKKNKIMPKQKKTQNTSK